MSKINGVSGGWNTSYPCATQVKAGDGDKSMSVMLNVVDAKVQGPNVYEEAFALVPFADGSWKRFEMPYSGQHRVGSRPEDCADMHYMSLAGLTQADMDSIQAKGIAFGLQYRVDGQIQTLWCQGPDDNFGRTDPAT